MHLVWPGRERPRSRPTWRGAEPPPERRGFGGGSANAAADRARWNAAPPRRPAAPRPGPTGSRGRKSRSPRNCWSRRQRSRAHRTPAPGTSPPNNCGTYHWRGCACGPAATSPSAGCPMGHRPGEALGVRTRALWLGVPARGRRGRQAPPHRAGRARVHSRTGAHGPARSRPDAGPARRWPVRGAGGGGRLPHACPRRGAGYRSGTYPEGQFRLRHTAPSQGCPACSGLSRAGEARSGGRRGTRTRHTVQHRPDQRRLFPATRRFP